jgi:hypothetical protein
MAVPEANSSKRPVFKGKISASGIIDALEVAGIKCGLRQDKVPTLVVTDVHLGTPALYAGVMSGDIIRKLIPSQGRFQLVLERDGKTYQAEVRSTEASKLLSASANDFNLLVKSNQVTSAKLTSQSAESNRLNGHATTLTANGKTTKAQSAR